MRNNGIPFTYTKAYGVQSEISHVTVTRVAGQEVDFHRNVNTYHRDMMFKINSLCREQKRLKEYRRKLLKRKRKSSELDKEKEAAASESNYGNQSKKKDIQEEDLKTIEKQEKDEPMDVADQSSEDKNHDDEEPVSKAQNDEMKSQTKMETSKTNENVNNKEVIIVEAVEGNESDEVVTLISEHHEEEPVSNSQSRASCEINLQLPVRESGIFGSTPRIIPPITSRLDTGFTRDGTPKAILSSVRINKGTGLKPDGRGPLREISTNLIKLQYTSNHKLLCRLVDTIAHRQNGKEVLSNKQNVPVSKRPLKRSKPGFDQERFTEQEIENHDVKVDSLPHLSKIGIEKNKNGVVTGCPRHSSRSELQSSFDASQLTREDMTGKRVLPPISERGGTNTLRHDINRYLRAVSPVDPLLKRLSRYEKVNQVTWKSAFSSLKNLKCL